MTREKFIEELNFNCKVDGKEVWLNIMPCLEKLLDEHEAQLKAKDEEINGLGCRIYHAEGYISDLHNNPKDKKFYYKKARSIVAMLFWRAKKDKRLADEENKYFTYDMALHSFILFKQAYKMLKDNK